MRPYAIAGFLLKSWGRVLASSLLASIVGLIVAPMATQTIVWLCPRSLPAFMVRISAFGAYELGLWGSGLALYVVARRVGWLAGSFAALMVTSAPAAAETTLALALGRWPPGFSTWTGALVRVSVATLVLFVAYRLRLALHSAGQDGPAEV